MLTKICGAAATLVCLAVPASAGTILTFDIPGIGNHVNVPQAYGDRVSGPSDAVGSYGTDNGVYTPNVVVDYGTAGEDPALWTTGYGDLTNIILNDADGDTTLSLGFTADAGYLVTLASFDIASFFTAGQTIQGARAIDRTTNAVLWSLGSTFITGATHLTLAPNVMAAALLLEVDLTGLGSLSDDIGLDNIRFGQSQSSTQPPAVPEPATLSLLGLGLVGLCRSARRARASE